jgi:phage shock protein A
MEGCRRRRRRHLNNLTVGKSHERKSMLYSIGSIVLVLIGLFMFFNSKFGRQFWHAIRAQFGKLGDAAEAFDPAANQQQAINDAAAEIEKDEDGLAQLGGDIKSLTREVKQNTEDQKRLTNRIQKLVNEDASEEIVQEHVAALAEVEKLLKLNSSHLKEYQDAFDSYKARIIQNQKVITSIKQQAKNLNVRLRMTERMERLENIVVGARDGEATNALLTAQRQLQEKLDNAEARVEVRRELHKPKLGVMEALAEEKTEQEDEIRNRFKKTSASTPSVYPETGTTYPTTGDGQN